MTRATWTAAVVGVLLFAIAAGPAGAQMKLIGAGATFPEPIYAVWMYQYNQLKDVQVNYQGIGSSGGIRQIKDATVDFGATDAPIEGPELEEAGLVQFPMIIGGVVPICNIRGVGPGELRLSTEVLASIFAGEITFWDDEGITSLNPDLELPNDPITVVHRAEGSGTTWIFTDFLDKVSPSWRENIGRGKLVNWPAGVGAKGNPGVAAYVQRVNGSVGYVEFAFAVQNKLAHITLRNRDGQWVEPTIESFQAAAANADWENTEGYYLVLTDQPGEESWPIVGASFILVYAKQDDVEKAKAMLEFFDWCYDHGDQMAVQKHYVPIPDNVVEMVRNTWRSEITADGEQVCPPAKS
ncbi:MAG: phosphate ABC transporter substrate-binding protein PstS [Candidatus Eisenbacteria bacterium]|nr:phosphate ABC transporter substrate-binding protein PstS [Candidatus Eisenbacteria bacterium]